MNQDRASGMALLLGSLGMLITMGLHPAGGHLGAESEHMAHIVMLARVVHTLGIVSICAQAFGFLGLGLGLGVRRAGVRAGLVALALGWIAVSGAALASGILGPDLIERFPELDAAGQDALHVVGFYNFRINQALAKVFVVSTAVGMLLWSPAMVRLGAGWRTAGIVGAVVGVVGLVGLASGTLHMDVTGFGMVVLGYSVWVVLLGALLLRADTT